MFPSIEVIEEDISAVFKNVKLVIAESQVYSPDAILSVK